MSMAVHEIIGLIGAAIAGAVVLGALSKQADTANVLSGTINAFSGLIGAIQRPVQKAA